jgi:hypothetical protein
VDDHGADRLAHRDRLVDTQGQIGRRLVRRVPGYRKRLIELHLTPLQGLEQQIQRHHLGQRSRIGGRVGIGLEKHLTTGRINHYVGVDYRSGRVARHGRNQDNR